MKALGTILPTVRHKPLFVTSLPPSGSCKHNYAAYVYDKTKLYFLPSVFWGMDGGKWSQDREGGGRGVFIRVLCWHRTTVGKWRRGGGWGTGTKEPYVGMVSEIPVCVCVGAPVSSRRAGYGWRILYISLSVTVSVFYCIALFLQHIGYSDYNKLYYSGLCP